MDKDVNTKGVLYKIALVFKYNGGILKQTVKSNIWSDAS